MRQRILRDCFQKLFRHPNWNGCFLSFLESVYHHSCNPFLSHFTATRKKMRKYIFRPIKSLKVTNWWHVCCKEECAQSEKAVKWEKIDCKWVGKGWPFPTQNKKKIAKEGRRIFLQCDITRDSFVSGKNSQRPAHHVKVTYCCWRRNRDDFVHYRKTREKYAPSRGWSLEVPLLTEKRENFHTEGPTIAPTHPGK